MWIEHMRDQGRLVHLRLWTKWTFKLCTTLGSKKRGEGLRNRHDLCRWWGRLWGSRLWRWKVGRRRIVRIIRVDGESSSEARRKLHGFRGFVLCRSVLLLANLWCFFFKKKMQYNIYLDRERVTSLFKSLREALPGDVDGRPSEEAVGVRTRLFELLLGRVWSATGGCCCTIEGACSSKGRREEVSSCNSSKAAISKSTSIQERALVWEVDKGKIRFRAYTTSVHSSGRVASVEATGGSRAGEIRSTWEEMHKKSRGHSDSVNDYAFKANIAELFSSSIWDVAFGRNM